VLDTSQSGDHLSHSRNTLPMAQAEEFPCRICLPLQSFQVDGCNALYQEEHQPIPRTMHVSAAIVKE